MTSAAVRRPAVHPHASVGASCSNEHAETHLHGAVLLVALGFALAVCLLRNARLLLRRRSARRRRHRDDRRRPADARLGCLSRRRSGSRRTQHGRVRAHEPDVRDLGAQTCHPGARPRRERRTGRDTARVVGAARGVGPARLRTRDGIGVVPPRQGTGGRAGGQGRRWTCGFETVPPSITSLAPTGGWRTHVEYSDSHN